MILNVPTKRETIPMVTRRKMDSRLATHIILQQLPIQP
jgi:hypothetical protein